MSALRRYLLLASCVAAAACSDAFPQGIDADDAARLEALGYLTWTEASDSDLERLGVERRDPGAAEPGINFYCSEPSDVVHFIDIGGNEVLSLQVPVEEPFIAGNRCKLVEPYDSASLLVLHEHTQITRMGFDSRPRWTIRGRYHHDLAVAGDGTIRALRDVPALVPAIHPERRIVDTEIVTLSPGGRVLRRVSLSAMVVKVPVLLRGARERVGRRSRENPAASSPVDVFHVNTVELVRTSLALGGGVRAEPGDLLVCFRNLDAIAFLDPREESIRWTWGVGELDQPHHPSVLSSGNLLVFDNGPSRGYSRLLEVDPRSRKGVWEYRGDPPSAFFSPTRGAVQELPNGNLLVTESERGHAFEIARSGQVVWEFWDPDLDLENRRRATLYRMTRLATAEIARWELPAPARERLEKAGIHP